MKIALVLTVKNEQRILRHNLQYHKAIGACHIFVYFDGSTDNGRLAIKDLDYVTVNNSIAPEKYEEHTYLKKFTTQAKQHHTARQCLNTYNALEQCKKMDIDWLISIDADELVCTNTTAISNLSDFFANITEDVSIVNLKTLEALQQRQHYQNVFAEESFFKTTHKFENRFAVIWKTLYNPFTKNTEKYSYWYGHHLGKGAIRVASNCIPHNVHRYKTKDGAPLKTINAGNILHYHAYDAEDFIKKFTNFSKHPDTFLSGNKVKSLKLLLRDIVNISGLSNEALEIYYKDNLLFNLREIEKIKSLRYLGFFKRKTPLLREITSVNKVFKNLEIH